MPQHSKFLRCLSHPGMAILVIVLFYITMIGSVSNKSLWIDETGHAYAGYTYWRYNDYRSHPEIGNLPARVAALPLSLGSCEYPNMEELPEWRIAHCWRLALNWFHSVGNDLDGMLLRGRMSVALLAVALAALVWWWSRSLFGPLGGLISLIACATSPTFLANGPLMTSDTACVLFYTASLYASWQLLKKFTLSRLLFSIAMMGLLFVSKMSASLIIVIVGLLVIIRWLLNKPIQVGFWIKRPVSGRWKQAALLAGACFCHAVGVVLIIWTFYGFRYMPSDKCDPNNQYGKYWHYLESLDGFFGRADPMLALQIVSLTQNQQQQAATILHSNTQSGKPQGDAIKSIRETVLTETQKELFDRKTGANLSISMDVLNALRSIKLLPEAYFYGQALTINSAQSRPAFLNGDLSIKGWWWYHPYAIFARSQVAFLALMTLSLICLSLAIKRRALMNNPGNIKTTVDLITEFLPLLILFSIYGTLLITSSLNLGERHAMPVFVPLFILCGAVTLLGVRSICTYSGLGLALLSIIGVMAIFPNYLPFCNVLVGGIANGHEHLATLEGGMELPATKRYIDKHKTEGPFYFSYAGSSFPESYGIHTYRLPGNAGALNPFIRRFDVPFSNTSEAAIQELIKNNPDCDYYGAATLPSGYACFFLLKPEWFKLRAGTYIISSLTLRVSRIHLDDGAGYDEGWSADCEQKYQDLVRIVEPLTQGSLEQRRAAFAARPVSEWLEILPRYDQYRFVRLTFWLWKQKPDDNINYGTLVYKLSDQEILQALSGPPPPPLRGPGERTRH